jgi:hypothetical protein
MRTYPLFGTVLLAACLSGPVLAQAPALDVKVGLWEMTSTVNVEGAPPSVDTSKMTPQQKAAVESAMKGAMGRRTHTNAQCLTKEMIQKSMFMPSDRLGTTCKQTMLKNTRTVVDLKVECTGAQTMTGDMHFEALSAVSTKGTMKMAITNQGKVMTVDSDFTGKWLRADCGASK